MSLYIDNSKDVPELMDWFEAPPCEAEECSLLPVFKCDTLQNPPGGRTCRKPLCADHATETDWGRHTCKDGQHSGPRNLRESIEDNERAIAARERRE